KCVFQFNFYGSQNNKRAMEWMFLNDGPPGHHYQASLREQLRSRPAFASEFFYPGNVEGWGAYVENYGKELGLYQKPEQELGKWEWDLVRSARVVLDVGIHYKGWSKEQALAYWKQNVPGQEQIADREVTRCINWAGQVLSYKVGEKVIKELLAARKATEGNKFDIRKFHDDYLKQGSLPLEVMQQALVT
ncbi:MAG: DUF885 domain-containing protein, partial [Hymenobacteraceae bacterium]|nr:DUF885 domain-containing protein [Hymenobacteraceae bacterium]MDX5395468.1 DUF885 domain-containing protein [Hymenobacteraceae bacterium]MDX5443570.1 DUF885 domain-containing protein [Hymenobacteraceae bacterium]MDX5511520.1 DUF885 domain-containing protein [Hymenobacteraceae bacterium]